MKKSEQLFDLTGRRVLLVGASGGIGACFLAFLAASGARVFAADRAPLSSQFSGYDVPFLEVDITDEASVLSLRDAVRDWGQGLDALVNAAGVLPIAPAEDLGLAQFRSSLDINLSGAFLVSVKMRQLLGQGGRMVHLSSVSSMVANPEYAAYASAKAGLSQLVRVLAREWAPDRVTVNALAPAMMETDLTRHYLGSSGFRDQALGQIPMGRFVTGDDLTGPLAMLLSEAGRFITGQTLMIDGGRTLI
ncbi:MAG: SDR family oxidoreductase [Pseudomonadota bacterium]